QPPVPLRSLTVEGSCTAYPGVVSLSVVQSPPDRSGGSGARYLGEGGMTGPRARATTRVAPASPALLALLVAAAVLLMHAMASTSGCTAGQPAPPSMMAGPVAAPAPAHPLWTDRQD